MTSEVILLLMKKLCFHYVNILRKICQNLLINEWAKIPELFLRNVEELIFLIMLMSEGRERYCSSQKKDIHFVLENCSKYSKIISFLIKLGL